MEDNVKTVTEAPVKTESDDVGTETSEDAANAVDRRRGEVHRRRANDDKTIAQIRRERQDKIARTLPIVWRAIAAVAIGLVIAFALPPVIAWLAALPTEVWVVAAIIVSVSVFAVLQIADGLTDTTKR